MGPNGCKQGLARLSIDRPGDLEYVDPAEVEYTVEGVAVAVSLSSIHRKIMRDWVSKHGQQHLTVTGWFNSIDRNIAFTDDEGLRLVARLAVAVVYLRVRSRANEQCSSTTLETIWQCVHEAVTYPFSPDQVSFVPSRSAQGFLAVPLCSQIQEGKIEELIRLHVWLPDGQRGEEATGIHAHQPFAQSWILAGRGTDFQYEAKKVKDVEKASHAVFVPRWSDSKTNGTADAKYKTHRTWSTLSPTGELVSVRQVHTETHGRDASYIVPAGRYHSSDVSPTEFHATLFFFDSSRGFEEDAGVLCPVDFERHALRREAAGITAKELAEQVEVNRMQWSGDQGG